MFSSLTALAGMPTIVALSGTSLTTTALAAILEHFPTFTGPIICAPDPITTSLPIVGATSGTPVLMEWLVHLVSRALIRLSTAQAIVYLALMGKL